MENTNAKKLLEELIQLEALRNPNQGTGQRQFTRHVARGEAEIVAMDRRRLEQVPIMVQLRDFGRGGIGVVSKKSFDVDSLWRINFIQNGFVIGEMAGIARHSRSVGEDVYLTGMQFCADSGLMSLMGIQQNDLLDKDSNDLTEGGMFLAPGEVA